MTGERWALVEMMGHRLEGGLVSERSFAGVPFVQIRRPKALAKEHSTECSLRWASRLCGEPGAVDVPTACDCTEEFDDLLVGAAAIYCLTFSDEQTVRARLFPAPWRPAFPVLDEVLEDAVPELPRCDVHGCRGDATWQVIYTDSTEILVCDDCHDDAKLNGDLAAAWPLRPSVIVCAGDDGVKGEACLQCLPAGETLHGLLAAGWTLAPFDRFFCPCCTPGLPCTFCPSEPAAFRVSTMDGAEQLLCTDCHTEDESQGLIQTSEPLSTPEVAGKDQF